MLALMLVRVVPSIKSEEKKEKSNREQEFYQKYGDDSFQKDKVAERVKNLYEIIKKDSNIDQSFV